MEKIVAAFFPRTVKIGEGYATHVHVAVLHMTFDKNYVKRACQM